MLLSAMRVQDGWHAAHFPHLPSAAADRAAVWFEQVEDASRVMTTARWDSVAAHGAWIASDANRRVMAGLEGHIVAQDTVLFHVGADIFGGGGGDGGGDGAVDLEGAVPLLQSPVVSVSRIFVARKNKEAFTARFGELKGILEGYVRPHLVRFGWREDLEADAQEEFVLVCGWETVEKHFAFAEAAEFPRYGELRQLASRVDLKHYKRCL